MQAATEDEIEFERVMKIATENRDLFSDKFLDWLPSNPHIWVAFVEQANLVHRFGYKHYSARTIVHVLRHHSALEERGDEPWKINNDHSPYLARLYDLAFPERAGMWEYRETKKVTQRQQHATTN